METYTLKETKEKFLVDKSFFQKIDTEEKAYWLGFILADGHVHSDADGLTIALDVSDKNHLLKFAHILKYPSEAVRTYTTKANTTCVKFNVSGNTVRKDLEALKVLSNKTYYQPLPEIDSNLIRHMIRGYFDGDGCVSSSKRKNGNTYKSSVEITSTLKILTDIKNAILSENFTENISVVPTKQVYRLRISSSQGIRLFYKFLYENASVFLERKFLKYQEVLTLLPPIKIP